MNFIGEFQRVVVEEARRRDVEGVICGHIHHATIEDFDGIRYINTGDWVESCTAVAEDFDGNMHLLRWNVHSDQFEGRRGVQRVPGRRAPKQIAA